MDYLPKNMLYLIPVIVICILVYIYIIAPMITSPIDNSIPSTSILSSDSTLHEGFVDSSIPDNMDSELRVSSPSIPILRKDGKLVKRKPKRNIESFQEGDVFSDIADGFKDIKKFFNDIVPKLRDIPDKMNQFGGMLSNIGNQISGLWNGIMKEFNNIKGAINGIINKITEGFSQIINIFKKIGVSFSKYALGIGEFFARVFNNIARSFLYIPSIFLWIFSYIKCGIKFILNIPKCYQWYGLETIGHILYSPFMFSFWYFEATGWEKFMWKNIEELDCMFHTYTGYHIIHYTDDIRDKCYTCCTEDFPTFPKMDWSWKVKFELNI